MASNYRTDAGLIKTCACGNKSDGLAPPQDVTILTSGAIVPRVGAPAAPAPRGDSYREAARKLRSRMDCAWAQPTQGDVADDGTDSEED